MASKPSTGQQIDALATKLHSIAFQFEYGPRSHRTTEALIDQAEQIAIDLREVVRGNAA